MKTAVAGVPDMYLLTGFAQPLVLKPLIDNLFKLAPLRHMKTSRGFELAAAMTNCGSVGWVSGRGGYSYSEYDPASGKPWPPMPAQMKLLAEEAAQLCGYDNFHPDACLINRYLPGKGMGAHRDNDERDLTQPIVSVLYREKKVVENLSRWIWLAVMSSCGEIVHGFFITVSDP